MSNEIQENIDYMTKAHLRNVQQLAVFKTGTDDIYAINIAKVKSFVIMENIEIYDTPSETDIIEGISTIMGDPVVIINLDRWTSREKVDPSVYTVAIYCEFSNIKVAFLVKTVIDIMEKTTQELKSSDNKNRKVTYTTQVELNGKMSLCTIFNAEQLLEDVGLLKNVHEEIEQNVTSKIETEKVVLCAEDSAIAQKILMEFLKKVNVKYEIYDNGQLLLERLQDMSPEEVGLIITDIEMPITDGYQVVTAIKSEASKFKKTPIVANSSMTSQAVINKMKSIGADDFIGKGDIKSFFEVVKKYLDVNIDETV
jgi:two-component system chemotaxis response regulator CheV